MSRMKYLLQREISNLKGLTFREKAAYIWEYYKGVFAGIIIAGVIISIGVQMFQNSQLKSQLETQQEVYGTCERC